MTTAATDKAYPLAGVDSSRTLNESYHSSDYSVEEEPQEDSAVATAKLGDLHKAEPGLRQPLKIIWSFGYNSSLPVRNLSNGNKKMIFYTSAHTGILYDCNYNEQFLLQGHSNPITCTCSSADKRWLLTADVGKDCIVSIWDSYTDIPVRSIFDGLGDGIIAAAMSGDARFIVLIGCTTPQVVSVWDWTSESDEPVCRTTLDPVYGQQTFVDFNQTDPRQFVSNGDEHVIFYDWKSGILRYHNVFVDEQTFNKPVGLMVQSCYIPMSTRALTVTTEGSAVVWEVLKQNGVFSEKVYEKMPLKLTKLHSVSITTVTLTESMIVTGDAVGCIKFLDHNLKMLNWYDSLKFGPIVSISFASTSNSMKLNPPENVENYPDKSTLHSGCFIVPDFIVSTASSVIAHVTTNGTFVDVIAKEHDAAVMAMATHPSLSRILIGSYSGNLKLWDYQKKLVMCNREFDQKEFIQCLAFDPKGDYIGVGFTNGTVRVLDGVSLEDCCPLFRHSKDCVTHIAFSHDSMYIATADMDRCVTVFEAGGGQNDDEDAWKYLGHYRSHFKHITDLLFGQFLDSGLPRLLSLGSDRRLVEYDLANSSEDDLRLLSSERIEQSAIPTAMTWYPPVTKETFLLMTNSQYKIKLFNASTKMCRKTLLGPTYNSPLRKVLVLPSPIISDEMGQQIKRYLAFINNDKIGLLILPHDGNPYNSTCLIAHPGMSVDLACSCDGKYLFTAGGEDCIVNMWNVDTEALEASKLLGGEELVPFYPMLEGGRDGDFFAEMKDYFYYAQIKNQGPEVMASRNVSTKIPITQIPNVMRALGFYPSEQEIMDMMNEVKFSQYIETNKTVVEIDLNDFIKLYINHRPAFGLAPSQISKAFNVLGEDGLIDQAKFVTLMQEKGEHLTETELADCLMMLLNYNEDPEVDPSITADSRDMLFGEIVDKMSAKQFAEELLGLTT